MPVADALRLAIALHESPGRVPAFRSRALPDGVTEVLRVATGQQAVVEPAAEELGLPADLLVEAACFFVEQLLLAAEFEGNPWRVLGVAPDADVDIIRENRRLLLALVHPDRGGDWAATYADRVNRAWRELKTPEGRLAARRELDMAAGASGPMPAADGLRERASPSPDTAGPRSVVGRSGDGRLAPLAGWQADAMPPIRRDSRRQRAGLVVAVVTIVLGGMWWSSAHQWQGDEIFVPMADSPAEHGLSRPDSMVATQPQALPDGPPNDRGQSYITHTDASDAGSAGGDQGARSARATAPRPPERAEASRRSGRPGGEDAITVNAPPVELARETDPPRAGPPAPIDARSAVPPDRRPAAVVASTPLPGSPHAPLPAANDSRGASDPPSPAAPLVATASPTIEAPGSGQPSHALSSTPGRLTLRPIDDSEVRFVLSRFVSHYVGGELAGLLGLFSSEAHRSRGGVVVLAADYSKLFASTSDRRLSIEAVRWGIQEGEVRGSGRFEASYRREGRLFRQASSGRVSFVMTDSADGLRLLRLDSVPEE